MALDRLDILALGVLALAWASAVGARVTPVVWRGIGGISASVALWLVLRTPTVRGRDAFVTLIASLGVVIALITWCEAMGWIPSMAPRGFAPGGLFGHRNRMAHVLVLCLPAVAGGIARSRGVSRVGLVGACALLVGAIVLSRSRAAWLGSAMVLAFAAVAATALRPSGAGAPAITSIGYCARLFGAAGLGILGATVSPTALSWKDQSPFLSTVRRLAEVDSGSGRARKTQAATSLRMLSDAPYLGVGPGNWPIAYGRYALRADPSYRPELAVPTDRLPNGDWVGIASELGLPALLLLMLAGMELTLRSLRAFFVLRQREPFWSFQAALLVGLLGAIAVMGLADAVLMTPGSAAVAVSALAVWSPRRGSLLRFALSERARGLLLAVILMAAFRPTAAVLRQLYAHHVASGAASLSDLETAARWNPADFGSRLRLARIYAARGRCELAVPHAIAAARLFPTSLAPIFLLGRCSPSSGAGR